jgi:hypothetical protein
VTIEDMTTAIRDCGYIVTLQPHSDYNGDGTPFWYANARDATYETTDDPYNADPGFYVTHWGPQATGENTLRVLYRAIVPVSDWPVEDDWTDDDEAARRAFLREHRKSPRKRNAP